jgi:3-methyladenine DNA glycosylase AlkD
MDAAAEAEAALRALAEVGTPGRAQKEQGYLKLPGWRFLGAAVPDIRRQARSWLRAHRGAEPDAVWGVVAALWDRAPVVYEGRKLAATLLETAPVFVTPDRGAMLERMLRESETWALVDSLAASTLGPVVHADPVAWRARVQPWADDPDVWIRRAALLLHLLPLRRGEGDWVAFTALADRRRGDPEFWIRKALGWVLRETGKADPQRVADWVAPRAAALSGLTFREATRRLPAPLQAELQAARRAG